MEPCSYKHRYHESNRIPSSSVLSYHTHVSYSSMSKTRVIDTLFVSSFPLPRFELLLVGYGAAGLVFSKREWVATGTGTALVIEWRLWTQLLLHTEKIQLFFSLPILVSCNSGCVYKPRSITDTRVPYSFTRVLGIRCPGTRGWPVTSIPWAVWDGKNLRQRTLILFWGHSSAGYCDSLAFKGCYRTWTTLVLGGVKFRTWNG